MARSGLYLDAPHIPCVVGYEVAGTVNALGEGVTEFQIGQPVLALTHFGGYADVVCVPALTVFARPPQMSAQVGAGIAGQLYHCLSLPLVYGHENRVHILELLAQTFGLEGRAA